MYVCIYIALELQHLLDEERLIGVPLLIFANKQDLLSALSPVGKEYIVCNINIVYI